MEGSLLCWSAWERDGVASPAPLQVSRSLWAVIPKGPDEGISSDADVLHCTNQILAKSTSRNGSWKYNLGGNSLKYLLCISTPVRILSTCKKEPVMI